MKMVKWNLSFKELSWQIQRSYAYTNKQRSYLSRADSRTKNNFSSSSFFFSNRLQGPFSILNQESENSFLDLCIFSDLFLSFVGSVLLSPFRSLFFLFLVDFNQYFLTQDQIPVSQWCFLLSRSH